MNERVRVTKVVGGKWEERNNEDKEESVKLEREKSEDVHILGSWVSDRADVRNSLHNHLPFGHFIHKLIRPFLSGTSLRPFLSGTSLSDILSDLLSFLPLFQSPHAPLHTSPTTLSQNVP